IAFSIPMDHYLQVSLAFFWLLAFSSATHDIAADGFYMLGLTSGEQSFFVGIRNTFYRLASIFGQGVLVMLAGWMEEGKILPSLIKGNIPLAWSLVFYFLAALFIGLTLYHHFILPHPASDAKRQGLAADKLLKDFILTFVAFFKKKNLLLMFFFLLTYRLGESQLVKIASPFLLDTGDKGGLGLSTATVGMIYGTIGVISLLAGGIIGGLVISRYGLKKWIIPMAIALNVTD
ncbi:MFS transporter, partial [termite gut metagenome]